MSQSFCSLKGLLLFTCFLEGALESPQSPMSPLAWCSLSASYGRSCTTLYIFGQTLWIESPWPSRVLPTESGPSNGGGQYRTGPSKSNSPWRPQEQQEVLSNLGVATAKAENCSQPTAISEPRVVTQGAVIKLTSNLISESSLT
jgi:hypothetical protein